MDNAPSELLVMRWGQEFKNSGISINSEPLFIHPVEMIPPEILKDSRLKLYDIAQTAKISKNRLDYILHILLKIIHNRKGNIFINYIEKGKTSNGKHILYLLDRFKKDKTMAFGEKKSFFFFVT